MKKSEKILILGLGGVGRFVAQRLSQEGHHVTVIEHNREKIRAADTELDARLIRGDARSFVSWHEAEAHKMDYLIACTSDDALNIVASKIGKELGIPHKIARVRTMEVWSPNAIVNANDLEIGLVIRPEELAAQEIVRLIKMSSGNVLLDVVDRGTLQVLGVTVTRDAPFVGRSLAGFAKHFKDIVFRVVAAARDIETIIPGGDFVIRPDDRLYVMASPANMPRLMSLFDVTSRSQSRDNVLIIGGGMIGVRIAQLLQRTFDVRMVERDEEHAEELQHKLRATEVLHGDGSLQETLLEAGLMQMDTIITTTGDNETNIMTAVLAKHLIDVRSDGARTGKTVALVKKEAYVSLASTMGTDIAIDAKVLAANQILRYIRRDHVLSVSHLHGSEAEAVELIAVAGSAITRKPLHALSVLNGRITIGAVRDPKEGGWEVADGSTQVKAGDRVVCICRERDLGELQRLFL